MPIKLSSFESIIVQEYIHMYVHSISICNVEHMLNAGSAGRGVRDRHAARQPCHAFPPPARGGTQEFGARHGTVW